MDHSNCAREGKIDSIPFVTAIVPIRNERRFIRDCLEGILAQDYPGDRLEILVADGMSTDGTREAVQALVEEHPERVIRLLDNPRHIFSTGFNLGLQEACGDVVIMVGGHMVMAEDYVSRCVAALSEGYDCVGGYIETISLDAPSETISVAMSSAFGVGGVGFRTRPNTRQEVDTVAFGAYSRSAVERSGSLDESMVRNQDDEYNYRLRKLGVRILLFPDIHCRYYSRSNLRSMCAQYFRYGYWKVRVMQKHPFQMRLRHFVPAAFVAALFASIACGLLLPHGAITLFSLLVLYGSAALSAAALSARDRGWRHFPKLPAVFFCLHFCYGFGFILGMIRFLPHWLRMNNEQPKRTPDGREPFSGRQGEHL